MAKGSKDGEQQSLAAAVEHDGRELFALSVRAMEAADIDLSPTALRALLVLDDLGSCTLGELADRLTLSHSATSRMVDKLVVRALVSRRTAPGDRRQVTLTHTAAGRRVTKRVVRRRREAIAEAMAEMTAEDRERLRVGLHAFAAAQRQQIPSVPKH